MTLSGTLVAYSQSMDFPLFPFPLSDVSIFWIWCKCCMYFRGLAISCLFNFQSCWTTWLSCIAHSLVCFDCFRSLIQSLYDFPVVFLFPSCRHCYWVVYGVFSVTEWLLDFVVSHFLPFYHALKIVALVWCFLPETRVQMGVCCAPGLLFCDLISIFVFPLSFFVFRSFCRFFVFFCCCFSLILSHLAFAFVLFRELSKFSTSFFPPSFLPLVLLWLLFCCWYWVCAWKQQKQSRMLWRWSW